MRASISVDVGSFDLYLSDIAEQVAANSLEEELLVELAQENESISKTSRDGAEQAFTQQAARKLRELAKWFKENAP